MRSPQFEPSRFHLSDMARHPINRKVLALLGMPLEKLLSIDRINTIYRELQEQTGDGDFLTRALKRLDIAYEFDPEQLAQIPKQGPLVVVANHPYGLVEGMILADLLRRVRLDVKILANHLLSLLPATQGYVINVDPFNTRQAKLQNRAPLKEALKWLERGGALAMFPAGEVAHLKLGSWAVVDPPWNASAARLAQKSGATMMPVHLSGGNGAWFQLAGLLHPRMRTLLLPRQIVKKRARPVQVRIGSPLAPDAVAEPALPAVVTQRLRRRTYWLGVAQTPAALRWPDADLAASRSEAAPVAAPMPPQLLQEELAALAPERTLLDYGDYQVLFAPAAELPHILREIGRLREQTFRAVGEGTGLECDLDRFDPDYWHLVLWHRMEAEIVGAYRVCRVDETVQQRGVEGLYTHTLFELKPELLESLGPALEMGRSFVRLEYQRAYAPLLLLWRGIGEILLRERRYKVFIGPVSVSRQYPLAAQQLIQEYLKLHHADPRLMRLVRPRHPALFPVVPEVQPAALAAEAADIDDISRLITDLDRSLGGVPVLLRQYIKLGGQLLGWNVDPAFSDVMDALLTVDLRRTEPRVLERFMGKQEAMRFMAEHGLAYTGAGGGWPEPGAVVRSPSRRIAS